MRVSRSLLFCAAAVLISAGCEVHERGAAPVGVEVSAGGVQGPVIDGGVAIDVEPDPAQRQYIYDEGYPPGCYVYENYYYYNGYRYPRDVFVNQYVQENIRQHRFVNADENRRQGQQIEQRQREEFTRNHGVRQTSQGRPQDQRAEQAPVRQPEAPRADVERPENKAPFKEEHRATVDRPENRPPANEERPTNVQRPENKTPVNEERPANAERQESKAPTDAQRPSDPQHPENKAKPENEQRKSDAEEPRKEEGK